MTKTYICLECGELTHECTINDNELTVCPRCKKKITRVYKAPHYSFKCDGFCGKGFA